MKILCIMSVIVHVIMGQTGYEIAKMVDERNKPKDQSSKTTMILTNSKGRTRTSTIYSKILNGGEKQINSWLGVHYENTVCHVTNRSCNHGSNRL